jgi:hypothetical protein
MQHYKTIATHHHPKRTIASIDTHQPLWEKVVTIILQNIQERRHPTIQMEDGFEMDDPSYDTIFEEIKNPRFFETSAWQDFCQHLRQSVPREQNIPLSQTDPIFDTITNLCLQKWQHEISERYIQQPIDDTSEPRFYKPHPTRTYPTLPIPIRTSPNSICDPELLAICQERAQNPAPTFALACEMLISTVGAFPMCFNSDPLQRYQPKTIEDISAILKAIHSLHSDVEQQVRHAAKKPSLSAEILRPLGRAFPTIHPQNRQQKTASKPSEYSNPNDNTIKQPERFIEDYVKFGDNPFLNSSNKTLLTTLQKSLPDASISSLRKLHHELRKIIPRVADYDYCHNRCLWILDKLSLLRLPVGTIKMQSTPQDRTSSQSHKNEQWTYHIAPVIFTTHGVYVFEMLSSALLTEHEWLKIAWIDGKHTCHISQGYTSTPQEIETATQVLAKLYYRELEMPIL